MVITPVQLILGLTFIILGFEVDSASSECCDSLTVFYPNDDFIGKTINGEFSKIPNRFLNGKTTYKHSDVEYCIYASAGGWAAGNHWKADKCKHLDGSSSTGYLLTGATTNCPEDAGKLWRGYINPGEIDSRITVLCTGALDPDLTPFEYNVCGDGSCAYVGGDLASTLNEMATSSSQTIEIECCNSGSIESEIKTCGNGKSCSEICGPDTGCVTIKTSSDTDDKTVCTETMDENWCQQSKIVDDLLGKGCQIGGKRKKRASCACVTPIWHLSYCTRKVQQVTRYPECCFHPYVRKFSEAKETCCTTHKICV